VAVRAPATISIDYACFTPGELIILPEAVFDGGVVTPESLGAADNTKIVPSRHDFAALASERNSNRSIVEAVPSSLLRTTRP
jgi:hypothetical protein